MLGLAVAFGHLRVVRRIGVMPRDPQDGYAVHHGLQVSLEGICLLLGIHGLAFDVESK